MKRKTYISIIASARRWRSQFRFVPSQAQKLASGILERFARRRQKHLHLNMSLLRLLQRATVQKIYQHFDFHVHSSPHLNKLGARWLDRRQMQLLLAIHPSPHLNKLQTRWLDRPQMQYILASEQEQNPVSGSPAERLLIPLLARQERRNAITLVSDEMHLRRVVVDYAATIPQELVKRAVAHNADENQHRREAPSAATDRAIPVAGGKWQSERTVPVTSGKRQSSDGTTVDLKGVTEHVIQTIDRRIIAERERLGRI